MTRFAPPDPVSRISSHRIVTTIIPAFGPGANFGRSYTCAEALAIAGDLRPRVAFLDLSMPGMNGRELAQRLRKTFAPSELTLVAVTGLDAKTVAGEKPGFDHHLLKPVTGEQVSRLLDSLDNAAR